MSMEQWMKAAQERARKTIEETYFGTLTVTELQKVKDPKTGITKSKEAVTLEGQPCRLSFKTVQSTSQNDAAAELVQVTKLFVSPDVDIKAGSKLTITQEGVTTDYAYSGVAAVYPTHQEIVLQLFERYA